jgi:peptidoglycan hydrolase-like protein with peptidoglycan-binding domain
MKFSSTMTLALVLAAGMAAAASAQTAPGSLSEPKSSVSSEPKSSISSEPKSTIAKPLTGSMQPQQGLNDIKAPDNKAASSAQMKSVEPKAKSAEMKAAQPRAKRIAHAKAVHPKRVVHLRHPGMHGQNLAQAQQKLSPDQIKGAQEQLKSAGLYNGPTDGMMDPDTRAALARFQQQNGMRRTQTLDPQTLARLNSGQTSGVGSSAPSSNQGTAPPSAGGSTTGQQPINR